ncbi:hypothetical protein [Streptomyces sp. NPDC005374]|uniref:hypothetical protein n=1 Tax=Streptomyces sp. NPDC005374 TaxID=3364713 RepID=UPI0036A19E1D
MENPTDSTAAARHARFGALPERIRYEDMVVEKSVTASAPTRNAHAPESQWTTFSCLALDLGL